MSQQQEEQQLQLLAEAHHAHEYQPGNVEGNRSLPATPQRLQNTKCLLGGLKMADGVWKGVYP